MLRSIGSVTLLALFMVGCGGGGGTGGGGSLATYSIGGKVTGLTGSGLVLQTNAGDVAPVSKEGAFIFTKQLGSGAGYRVFVQTQPSSPTQNCVVTNGTGFVGTANITNVAVACSTAGTYTVSGTVSGLVGSGLTLAICVFPRGGPGWHAPNCNTLQKQVSANGAVTLATGFADYSGGDYVSIYEQPSSPPQDCVISNAAISLQAANDTGFAVACADHSVYSFVTNAADNTLSSYSVDETTGAVAVIGAPTAAGKSPHAILGFQNLFSQDKKFVFVGNEVDNDVSAFAVNPMTGALTAVPGSPFAAGIDPQAMASVGGSQLYVANAGSDTVSAYSIDGDTGALTPMSPATYPTGKGPASVAVAPFVSLIYVGSVITCECSVIYVANHGGSNDITAFSIDLTGVLTPVPGSPFPAVGNPLSLAVGAGYKFLYTANPDATNPSISGFSVDLGSGALTPLSGSPFPIPVSHYIATDQTGAYLYVTSGTNILGYAINATNGALTALPGFPVATGANAYSITIDPTNRNLYVTNDDAANVGGFTLDASTGALTPMAGSPFPAGNHPEFIATF
jgi:6-phosphogluconolactonase